LIIEEEKEDLDDHIKRRIDRFNSGVETGRLLS